MGTPNQIDVTILENGTVRVVTGSFDGAKHFTAEKFMLWLDSELGGETKIAHAHGGHVHTHEHEHEGHKH